MIVRHGLLVAAVLAGAFTASGGGPLVRREYVNEVSPESEAARAVRHERVAARRRGPIVVVHRGASSFAPENTIEAYVAAMDFGADGCEVDVRRSRDGILYLFHDDMLDRVTDGFGRPRDLTYRELLALHPQVAFGRPIFGTPPTFAALLDLARQRAMLLHLDIKEAGLDAEIEQLLEKADAWDHVIAVNAANAPHLSAHPKIHPLRYKVPGLYDHRRDVDPEEVQAALDEPGEMIMVDDPRVAALVLARPPHKPEPYVKVLRLSFRESPLTAAAATTNLFQPMEHLRALSLQVSRSSVTELTDILEAEFPEAKSLAEDTELQRRRAIRILNRAWAAQALGELPPKTKPVVRLLEEQAKKRSAHPDWLYHGLDGAMAIRALGKLRATESVATLIGVFERQDPELAKLPNPSSPGVPISWIDYRAKMYVMSALGDMPCRGAKRFLRRYLDLDETQASRMGPPQFEEATRAYLRQRLTWGEIADVLRSRNSAVRGTAILECLDRFTEERGLALRASAPWALKLSHAKR